MQASAVSGTGRRAARLVLVDGGRRGDVIAFIGIIDTAAEAALRDGIVQRSAATGTVAPTSNVD
ncbi:hypothetical protein MRS60_30935 [Burkholderia pyrrocinia]|uniref:hypothetical protein n=1 Tax=Burkholderia TaxID=32008 RepID=UPI001FB38712|nr:hypothetical protein [Burkholderia pyrrocinia]UOB60391.1 hypothetical protein MRS60_30935 [Burkholderia pyrrocinia]